MHLDTTTIGELPYVTGEAIEAGRGARYLEELAQTFTARLYRHYEESIVLTRCYVTVPMSSLPGRNAAWVEELARAKNIAAELRAETPVISLVATSGRHSEWNSRLESRGHVGIPMVSASFIDAIPMMSRLMVSLGGGLAWIDAHDASHVVSQLGTVAGVFYVPDATTETDAKGRKVIPASDFVAEQGVKTVFGVGGAFSSGQILVLLVFCSQLVPPEIARQFQGALLQLKTSAARLLRQVFVDGSTITAAEGNRSAAPALEPARRPDAAALPLDPVARSERLAELLRARDAELAALNALYLKLESELEDRTRSLKIILNSTNDGLLLMDPDGSVYGETTAVVERWFGSRDSGIKGWDYLFGAGSGEAERFQMNFEQVVDDVLPFDAAADQLPNELRRDDRVFSLAYQPVMNDSRLVRVLVVVRDVTAQVAAARAEARARELQVIMANVLRHRRGFNQFLEDTRSLLQRLEHGGNLSKQRQDLHTIKGNAAVYGFQTFAELVHQLEGEVAEQATPVSAEQIAVLRDTWTKELSTIAEMVDIQFGGTVEITTGEHLDFVSRLATIPAAEQLLNVARSWRDESLAGVMNRLVAQTKRIADRLGKQIEIEVTDRGIRVPLDRTQALWANLVHVIRNAVDHGIESPAQRLALGKPSNGRIVFDNAIADNDLVISVSDDGSGVDWNVVRARAESLNLPCQTRDEMVETLFTEGFSTRAAVSEVSGRGVGLSALRAACSALGARVTLNSTWGEGTTVRVAVPMDQLRPTR